VRAVPDVWELEEIIGPLDAAEKKAA